MPVVLARFPCCAATRKVSCHSSRTLRGWCGDGRCETRARLFALWYSELRTTKALRAFKDQVENDSETTITTMKMRRMMSNYGE